MAKSLPRSCKSFCVGLGFALAALLPTSAWSQVEGADLAANLKSQIMPCWTPPTQVSDPGELVVDLHVMLNQDGKIASIEMLEGTKTAASRNPRTRAAAQAAMRAISQCQPYRLPPDRYNLWREISPLRFDPRQMMEQ